jgi:hypothetical protein
MIRYQKALIYFFLMASGFDPYVRAGDCASAQSAVHSTLALGVHFVVVRRRFQQGLHNITWHGHARSENDNSGDSSLTKHCHRR